MLNEDEKLQCQIILGILNNRFYTEYKDKIPKDVLGKQIKPIYETVVDAQEKYGRDLSLDEVHRLHLMRDPTQSEAKKMNLAELISQLQGMKPIGPDIAVDVIESAWVVARGQTITEIGFELLSGKEPEDNVQKLKRIVEDCSEHFTPRVDMVHEDMSVESILKGIDDEDTWKFNIPALAEMCPGVSPTHFIVGGARPNVGKTSLHATLIAAPGGFAWQGAKCAVALNEEAAKRVARRYLTSATGIPIEQIAQRSSEATTLYEPIRQNLSLFTANGMSIWDLDKYLERNQPDILVIDMLDKVTVPGNFARRDQMMREVYQQARELGKRHECVVIGFSQVSAEGEGIARLSQGMLEESRTGKAAEADLMLLVGKRHVEGEDDTDIRYMNIAKNKINGIHGMRACKLEGDIGRYVE